MVWVQAFPTNATLVSQSVGQIQANWLFLQTNINTDHFFNTGVTEGRHRAVQTLNQGAPGVAAGMSGVFFANTMGTANSSQPFWQNAVNTRQIPTILTGTLAYPLVNVLSTIFNFNGTPFVSGLFTLFELGSANIYYQAFIVWDNVAGGTLYINNPSQNGVFLIQSTALAGRLTFFSAAITGNFRWNLFTIPN